MATKNQNVGEAKVWLITGCSSGFGRCLIPAVLARGDKVIATARQISDLSYIDDENVKVLSLDVTATQDELHRKALEAKSAFGRIDVLMNNAGYVVSGVWEELSPEDAMNEFKTNFFGALNVTRAVLPFMRSRKTGAILFMGSIAGWHNVGGGGAYGASKSALEGAVESLSQEVEPLGIRVHIFVLGRFRTNILDAKNKRSKLDAEKGFADYAEVKKKLANMHIATQGAQVGDPLRAAERIVDIARVENITKEQAANLPLRIPLGAEAVVIMRKKCEDTLALLEKWAEFSASADFQDAKAIPDYDG
ncbi:hypothetical protein B0T10DRAFT_611659 [Thelonectria olida]|uniref:NAD(P)-binding protein n=1 Tax=Thelonectria olida TaxID=1576542 RepID=A0A9P8VQV0_9HYPO|nr:hypothetical protein B0T10DRAFT_611659 [Thelonectria olida]